MTEILRTPKNHRRRCLKERFARLSRCRHRNFVKHLVSEADAIYYPPQLDANARIALFDKVCQDAYKSSSMQEFFLFQKSVRCYNKLLTNTQ